MPKRLATLLNHGALGPGCPDAILASRARWERTIERRPYHWYRRELRPAVSGVRRHVSAFLSQEAGADVSEDEVAFYSCASDAIKSALAGISHSIGDSSASCMVLETGYHAVRGYVASTFESVVTVPVELPLTDESKLLGAVENAMATAAASGKPVRAAVLDHVSSKPALLMPLRAVAELCRRLSPGMCILADGAHCPGHVQPILDPSLVDLYAGNFHKWLHAPKTSAFLWTPTQGKWKSGAAKALSGELPALASEIETRGTYDECTRDYTPYLVLPRCISHHKRLIRGGVLENLKQLMDGGERLLCSRWGTEAAASPAFSAPRMRTVKLPRLRDLPPPGASPEILRSQRGSVAAAWLHDHLLDKHSIEAPIFTYRGDLYTRVSVAPGNTIRDFHRLAKAVHHLRQ